MSRTLPAAAAVALLFLSCAARRPTAQPPPLAGTQLEVVAQDLAGQEVRLPAVPGRVLVVDFFASWCEPCRAQLPHLDRLARELGEQGLDVYAVSFDEEAEAARAFAEQAGVSLPLLWDRGGERLGPALRIERLPTTLVVDRRGKVRGVHLGYDARAGARLEAEVRALLHER